MTTLFVDGGTNVYIRQNVTIDYNFNKDNPDSWIPLIFPVTINNNSISSGTATVIFTTDITFNSTNEYFTCVSSDIQFGSSTLNNNGSRPTIIINSVNNYPGLIENNNSNISIYNLIVNSNGSTLASGGGWIGQEYFARNSTGNLIVNCSTNGDISNLGGGIVGAYSADGVSSLTIIGCTTSGSIGTNAGGIVGSQTAGTHPNALLTISRCSSSGAIGTSAGGIVGSVAGSFGTVDVSNCYSTGLINGGGGIFGEDAGNALGTATCTNCYSTGNIINGGGIFGMTAGINGGTASATNCFSTGDMTGTSGGIFAQYGIAAGAFNCYTSGSIDGTSNGIWNGYSNDNQNGTNNYSEASHESSGWNTTNAAAHLTGVPSSSYYGTTWCIPVVGEPYQLSLSGYTPYSLSLTESTSQSIVAGNSTTGGVVPGYTYSLLAINAEFPNSVSEITIDSVTGVISVDYGLKGGVYTIIIYSSINPYSITTFTLNVSDAPVPTPCCALPMDLPNDDYVVRNEIISGNTILGNTNRRSPFPSYSFYYTMKMAQASKR